MKPSLGLINCQVRISSSSIRLSRALSLFCRTVRFAGRGGSNVDICGPRDYWVHSLAFSFLDALAGRVMSTPIRGALDVTGPTTRSGRISGHAVGKVWFWQPFQKGPYHSAKGQVRRDDAQVKLSVGPESSNAILQVVSVYVP